MIIEKCGVSVHYLGSKTKLIPFIKESMAHILKAPLEQYVFCDLFAGSGSISLAFKEEVASLICNDKEYFSYVLLRNILRDKPLLGIEEAVKKILTCKLQKGLIFRHYCLEGGEGRNYFSSENALCIDTFRTVIEDYKENEALYFCLLASLLEAAHAVSNTTSVYSAFLKELKAKAREKIVFKTVIYPQNRKASTLFCEDANVLIKSIQGEILYLDPPYNRRQYGANYHLLNTIARFEPIKPLGKTGVSAYESSAYCKSSTALDALEDIIRHAAFSYIFLSYNNEGIISSCEIEKMMQRHGKYSQFKHAHPRFKVHGQHGANPHTVEYLHVLEK